MSQILQQELKYLTGVGPKRASSLSKELGLFSFEDLLYYYPFKHIDRTKFYSVKDLSPDMANIQIIGVLNGYRIEGGGRSKRLVASFVDKTGALELIWFKGIKYISESLKIGAEYLIFGKPALFNNRLYIAHPEMELIEKASSNVGPALQPVYNTTEKLKNSFITSRTIQKLMGNLLKAVYTKIEETLPDYLIEAQGLLPLKEALLYIHFPKNAEVLKKAILRLKFEELFLIQLNLMHYVNKRNVKYKGYIFEKVGSLFNNFYANNLPFELTNAQKRVLKEIRKDLGSGKQMNRLLQGDVGSGKTLVALMAILIALDNGYQACIMAPTEILATQHYNTIKTFINDLGITIELLTGSTRKAKRTSIHQNLMDGKLNILVGTHAIIEDIVQFKSLGLAIIDEQHRFGVAQRARLWKKSKLVPHVLVMTATPIPRTLAMTLYGDLDVSVIDELPPGRKPVQTLHYFDSKRLRLFGFLKKQIAEGRQVYIVYPLIKESETLDYKDLEDGYNSIVRAFPLPDYKVSILHGKMKAKDKEYEMQLFKEGHTNIMVSTTVIEVGVDVPNASVMVLESAERFGLSQLHQLRGRVGRGANQSYCILMTSYKLSEDAKKRIAIMVKTNDGFEVAEADLKLRGPGDLEGTQQSGMAFDLKLANLGKDGQLLQLARNIATDILDEDPDLSEDKNYKLKQMLLKSKKTTHNWSDIS